MSSKRILTSLFFALSLLTSPGIYGANCQKISSILNENIGTNVTQEEINQPANILVGYAPESLSHLRSILPVVKKLALSGNRVTVFFIAENREKVEAELRLDNKTLISNHQKGRAIPIQSIHIPITSKEDQHKNFSSMVWKTTMHPITLILVYSIMGSAISEVFEDNRETFSTLLSKGQKWDLVIFDALFSAHMYAIATELKKRHGVPYVVAAPSMIFVSDAYNNALGQSWVIHPPPISFEPADSSDKFDPSRFSHRFINILENIGEFIAFELIERLAIPPTIRQITTADSDFENKENSTASPTKWSFMKNLISNAILLEPFRFQNLHRNSEIILYDTIELAYPLSETRGRYR